MILSALPLRCQMPTPGAPVHSTPTETITIDATAPSHPFPHYWEQMFSSGRAVLSLRDAYRCDLRTVRQITGFQYVRFHAILDDEVGVYDEDKQGKPIYNFSYVDQIYDGLLANNVKPFVELSFMPYKLAARPACNLPGITRTSRRQRTTRRWDDLITQFDQAHCRALRHRGGRDLVLRGMERAESGFLDRHSTASKRISSCTTTLRATSRR